MRLTRHHSLAVPELLINSQYRSLQSAFVGHEKTTMTYGLYSGGLSLAVKREALDKLAY
jgi:hypothetical protein